MIGTITCFAAPGPVTWYSPAEMSASNMKNEVMTPNIHLRSTRQWLVSPRVSDSNSGSSRDIMSRGAGPMGGYMPTGKPGGVIGPPGPNGPGGGIREAAGGSGGLSGGSGGWPGTTGIGPVWPGPGYPK